MYKLIYYEQYAETTPRRFPTCGTLAQKQQQQSRCRQRSPPSYKRLRDDEAAEKTGNEVWKDERLPNEQGKEACLN